MLNFRLHELDSVVDKFVLIESDATFLNKKKELTWPKLKHKFEKFLNKIEYIVIQTPFKEDVELDFVLSHGFQMHIRNVAVKRAIKLLNLNDDDVIVHSDVDEVWEPKKIGKIERVLKEYSKEHRRVVCKLRTYAWYAWDLEHMIVDDGGNALKVPVFATLMKTFKSMVASDLRKGGKIRNVKTIFVKNSVSHYSWFVDDVAEKARNGMGSDVFRVREANLVRAAKDRYRKRRLPPLACEKTQRGQNLRIVHLPIEANRYLPEHSELLL